MEDWLGKLLFGVIIAIVLVAFFALKVFVASFFPAAPEPHTLFGLAFQFSMAGLACVVLIWLAWRK